MTTPQPTPTPAALRALEATATPAPWFFHDGNLDYDPRPFWVVSQEDAAEDSVAEIHVGGREDAELIAAMRNALPSLLDAADRLAAATPEKPLFADVDWAADRGRGVAQLIGGGGTLLAEFDADRFATFLDMAGDTCDFLGGSEPGVSRLDLPDVAAMRAAIEKAHDHVADLCEGKQRWTMRIPAEPDRDSDLVIGAGLQAGEKALDRLAAAEQETARLTASCVCRDEPEEDCPKHGLIPVLRAEVGELRTAISSHKTDLFRGQSYAQRMRAERDAARASVAHLEQAQTTAVAAAKRLTTGLIACSSYLDKPFTDKPELTPWDRSIKPYLYALRSALGIDKTPLTIPAPTAGGAAAEPDLSPILAAIDNALRNGSHMNGASYAFLMLCDHLGVDRDALTFDPHWKRPGEDPAAPAGDGAAETGERDYSRAACGEAVCGTFSPEDWVCTRKPHTDVVHVQHVSGGSNAWWPADATTADAGASEVSGS